MLELEELSDELSEPFDPTRVEWKPQATKGDRALALPYATARTYQDRLDEIVGADWSDEYEVVGDDGRVVKCELTVCGVTRSGVGEADPSDPNTATSAASQAFKRAAVKFGVGRYLYDLPKTWGDYDQERKRFTSQARRKLRLILEGGKVERSTPAPKTKPASGDGNGKATPTDFWRLYNERGEDVVDRDKAREWAATGDWEQAIEKLKTALN